MPAADMYSDGEPEAPHQEASSEGAGGETAVLPKSILGGKEFKPGEEVVLRIVNIHDDSVEVEYASGHGGDEGGGEPPPEPAAQSGGGSSSMYD